MRRFHHCSNGCARLSRSRHCRSVPDIWPAHSTADWSSSSELGGSSASGSVTLPAAQVILFTRIVAYAPRGRLKESRRAC